jgi:prenyltransferase beta subunit
MFKVDTLTSKLLRLNFIYSIQRYNGMFGLNNALELHPCVLFASILSIKEDNTRDHAQWFTRQQQWNDDYPSEQLINQRGAC